MSNLLLRPLLSRLAGYTSSISAIFQVSSYMSLIRHSFPALRLVLWGPFGTGKSVTLNQAVHIAYCEKMVIVQLYNAMNLTRKVVEVEMSTFKQGRINDPKNAVTILQRFKEQNQHVWKTLNALKTGRDYEFTKSERIQAGRPITDIVEIGISAPFLASDCVGGLFRELKRYSSSGSFKLFVAVDLANSLWGRTLVKKADRTYASASDLTLVQHFRDLISSDWKNGCILLVADKSELANARDSITVTRHTPLELFGEEGFHAIEPFIPIETKQYTKEEISNMYRYYYDKRWLVSEKGTFFF
uniref:Small ribosomal subunit protein mS29 n=1 Tax=Angiostrongylus cantonensis TaxID=6313 RepID=A0A158P834_ANGCA